MIEGARAERRKTGPADLPLNRKGLCMTFCRADQNNNYSCGQLQSTSIQKSLRLTLGGVVHDWCFEIRVSELIPLFFYQVNTHSTATCFLIVFLHPFPRVLPFKILLRKEPSGPRFYAGLSELHICVSVSDRACLLDLYDQL